MKDDKSKRRRDRGKIAMNEAYEVRYWSKKFGVSKEELAEAVRSVGNDADKVRERLGK